MHTAWRPTETNGRTCGTPCGHGDMLTSSTKLTICSSLYTLRHLRAPPLHDLMVCYMKRAFNPADMSGQHPHLAWHLNRTASLPRAKHPRPRPTTPQRLPLHRCRRRRRSSRQQHAPMDPESQDSQNVRSGTQPSQITVTARARMDASPADMPCLPPTTARQAIKKGRESVRQAGRPASRQASAQAKRKGRRSIRQAGRPAGRQGSKQANKHERTQAGTRPCCLSAHMPHLLLHHRALRRGGGVKRRVVDALEDAQLSAAHRAGTLADANPPVDIQRVE